MYKQYKTRGQDPINCSQRHHIIGMNLIFVYCIDVLTPSNHSQNELDMCVC